MSRPSRTYVNSCELPHNCNRSDLVWWCDFVLCYRFAAHQFGLDSGQIALGAQTSLLQTLNWEVTKIHLMEALLTNSSDSLIVLALAILAGILFGYVIGSRHSRNQKRDLKRELNKQSLDMLDVKSKHASLSKLVGQAERKDRLLKLALTQLTKANTRVNSLQRKLDNAEKQHYTKLLRLRLVATQSVIKARRARKIAAVAISHAKRLETTVPPTQTINAPPPKSYGQAAAVPVKVVDQHSPDVVQDAIVRVSNRDSSRFARLRSSNEGRRFNSANLQAIDGINPSVEKKLNKAGIHRIEQLANMSDSDLAALRRVVGNSGDESTEENYTAAWKGGAKRLLTQS